MSLVLPGAPSIATELLDMGHRSGEALAPTGLVLHSTADPGATAEQIRAFFARLQSPNRVNAHLAVDWNVALQLVPYTEVAWHAGPTANGRFLGMELCETKDPDQFHTSFLSWIAIAVQLFKTHRWPVDDAHLWSHARVSATFHETDHTDPIDYLASHGHTWDDVVARVKAGVAADPGAV